MKIKLLVFIFGLLGTAMACNFIDSLRPGGTPMPTSSPTAAISIPTATEPAREPTPFETPAILPLPTQTPVEIAPSPTTTPPPEAILILEPGPGSRLTSPLRVVGEADPTFEQSLVVQLLLEDGPPLALIPVQIQADLGQRGPFMVEVPFTIDQERQGFLQVFAISARDGGIIHLSTVGVSLAPDGPVQIVINDPYPERIQILSPALGQVVSGGVVRVEGIGVASFEGTLIIEVLDEDGTVLNSQPIIVPAPEMGMPAPFSLDLPYTVLFAGAGRVVVRDPSPAFPGDIHISSVEIRLEP